MHRDRPGSRLAPRRTARRAARRHLHLDGLTPLRDHRFAWFFVARTVSSAGSSMAPVALAFAVLAVDPSPATLGLVLAARHIPLLVFLIVGGVIADRFSRALVLQVSHLLSALTQGLVAWLVIAGNAQVWHLVVLGALNGTWAAFTMPAIQGVVPQVVPRTHLQQANALLAFSRSATAVLGPSLAALLVVTTGAGWALAVDALSWLVAALCMLRVTLPPRPGPTGSLWRDLASGWSVFTSRTWLWVVVLACTVLNAVHAGAWSTLGPVVALQTPELGPTGWGYAVSAHAVGLVAITFVMLRVWVSRPLLAGMLGMLVMALPLVVLAIYPNPWVLGATTLLAGLGLELFGITWQTTIHEHVPEDHLSRVSAYDLVGSFAAIPLGQLLCGPLALVFGARPVILASAVVFVVVVLATLAVPSVRTLRRGVGAPPG